MSGEVSLPPPFDPFLSLRCGKTPPHWGSCLLSQRCPQTGPGHHSTWRLGTGDQPLTQATAEDRVGQVWSANFLPCAPAQVAAWPCPSELFCGWPRAMLAGAGARGRGGVLTLGLPPSCPSPRPCSCSFSSNRNLSCPAQPSACQSCWGRGGRARWPVPGLTALRFPAEGVIPRHSGAHTGSLLREKRHEHNRPTVEATRLLGCAGGRTRWSRAVGGARAVTRHPGEKRLKPATSLLCPTPPQEDYRCFLL